MKKGSILIFLLFNISISFSQSVGDFQSRQSGDWSDSDTWEEWTGSSWDNTANTPTSADGAITVINSHSITIISNLTIDQTTIQSNASVAVEPFFTLTIADGAGTDLNIESSGSLVLNDDFFFDGSVLNVEGSIFNSGSLSLSDPNLSSINFNANSAYQHAQNNGNLPIATWDSSSNLIVSGVTNAVPSNINQTFGNFTWNCLSQSATVILGITGSNTTIQGDFNILSTNGRVLALSTGTGVTLNVSNITLSGSSRFALTSSGNVTLNTTNFSNSSNFVFLATSGSGTLNVDGDFSHTAGTMQGTGTSQLNFSGATEQVYNANGGAYNNINFNVGATSIVNTGTTSFSGTGTFTLNAGSTLVLAETSGISSSTTSGAIRVSGTRTYNTGSTIEYNGTSTQALGNGFPASGVNLIINNTGGGVNMSSDVEISSGRSLTLTEGTLNIGDGNTLTLNGTVSSTNGGLSGGSLSNLVIGGTGTFGTLGFDGTNSLQDFTINRTSSGSVTLGGDLTVFGTLTQTAGDLNLNGNTLTLSGDYSRSAGSLNTTSASILVINGTGTLPSPIPLTGSIQKITLDRASSTFNTAGFAIVADTLNAFSGEFSFTGSALTVADGGFVERQESGSFTGSLSSAGSFDVSYMIGTNISTGPELPTNTSQLNNLTKDGGADLTLASNITINGDFELLNGVFDASTQSIDLKGDLNASASSVFENSSFTFSGTTNLTGANQPIFGDVTVTGTFNPGTDFAINGNLINNGTLNTSSGTVTFGGTTAISGSSAVTFNDINITGSLTAPSASNMIISGLFTNNGTFDANSGTIVFDGTTSFVGTTPDLANVQIDGTLTAPATLTIAGDFTNNGTFNSNSGILDLTGTGTRSIGGSSALSLFNLNVSGGTVNVNNASVAVEDGITVDANTILDLDGSGSGQVILISTSSKDAYIGQIPGTSSLTGELTVQRALYATDAGDNAYHVIGFPMTGVTVSDIQAEMPITGTFTGRSTGTGFDNNPSLYAYNESAGAGLNLNERYVAFPNSNNSESFSVGEGYYLYTYPGIIPVTIDGSGSVFSGDFSRSLSFTGTDPDAGWHIVANPYPAPSDWQNWGKTDIEGSTAYVYNSNNGNFIAYDASSEQLIPQGQGFWVRATSGSAEVTASESTKVVGTTPTFYREESLDRFEIILKTPNYDDISIVHFTEGATDNYEPAFDATRLLNTYETISTLSHDGKSLKVNRMAAINSSDSCRRSLFIDLEQLEVGVNYQIDFNGLANIEEYQFELIDHKMGNSQFIDDESLVSFEIEDSGETANKDRFELVFVKNAPTSFNISDVTSCFDESININLPTLENNTNYYVFNESGQLVESFDSGQTELSLLAEELNEGLNQYTLKASNALCDTVEIDSFTVEVSSPIDKSRAVSGSNICYSADNADYSINTQNGISYYLIQDSDTIDTVNGNGEMFKGQLDVSVLQSGDNSLDVLAVQENCSAVYLDQTVDIFYDTFQIDESISIKGSESCDIATANISLRTQAQVSYLFKIDNVEIQTLQGNGSELVVSLPDSLLEIGENKIEITANYEDCQSFSYQPISVMIHEQMTINGVDDISICKGEEIVLDVQYNVSAASFELSNENQTILTSTNGLMEFVPEVSGTYSINAVSENGCVSNELTFNVTLDSIDKPEVIVSDNILEASINAEAYQWFKDDVLLEGETSKILIVENSGEYKVEVFSKLCSEVSDAITFDESVLSVNKELSNKLSIYPNPVENNMTVDFEDSEIDSMEITIFDLSGKFISSSKKLSNHSELDMSYLESGIYLIEIATKKGVVTKRIVKQ